MLQRILMISFQIFQAALLQSYHAMWPRAITQLAPWCCERARLAARLQCRIAATALQRFGHVQLGETTAMTNEVFEKVFVFLHCCPCRSFQILSEDRAVTS